MTREKGELPIMDAESARKQRELDESFTAIGDKLPALWGAIMKNGIEEGFTRDEMTELLKFYILSTCPSGVHFHGMAGDCK